MKKKHFVPVEGTQPFILTVKKTCDHDWKHSLWRAKDIISERQNRFDLSSSSLKAWDSYSPSEEDCFTSSPVPTDSWADVCCNYRGVRNKQAEGKPQALGDDTHRQLVSFFVPFLESVSATDGFEGALQHSWKRSSISLTGSGSEMCFAHSCL